MCSAIRFRYICNKQTARPIWYKAETKPYRKDVFRQLPSCTPFFYYIFNFILCVMCCLSMACKQCNSVHSH